MLLARRGCTVVLQFFYSHVSFPPRNAAVDEAVTSLLEDPALDHDAPAIWLTDIIRAVHHHLYSRWLDTAQDARTDLCGKAGAPLREMAAWSRADQTFFSRSRTDSLLELHPSPPPTTTTTTPPPPSTATIHRCHHHHNRPTTIYHHRRRHYRHQPTAATKQAPGHPAGPRPRLRPPPLLGSRSGLAPPGVAPSCDDSDGSFDAFPLHIRQGAHRVTSLLRRRGMGCPDLHVRAHPAEVHPAGNGTGSHGTCVPVTTSWHPTGSEPSPCLRGDPDPGGCPHRTAAPSSPHGPPLHHHPTAPARVASRTRASTVLPPSVDSRNGTDPPSPAGTLRPHPPPAPSRARQTSYGTPAGSCSGSRLRIPRRCGSPRHPARETEEGDHLRTELNRASLRAALRERYGSFDVEIWTDSGVQHAEAPTASPPPRVVSTLTNRHTPVIPSPPVPVAWHVPTRRSLWPSPAASASSLRPPPTTRGC